MGAEDRVFEWQGGEEEDVPPSQDVPHAPEAANGAQTSEPPHEEAEQQEPSGSPSTEVLNSRTSGSQPSGGTATPANQPCYVPAPSYAAPSDSEDGTSVTKAPSTAVRDEKAWRIRAANTSGSQPSAGPPLAEDDAWYSGSWGRGS